MSICLNCNRQIPADFEFCQDCAESLDEMVDHSEMDSQNKVEMNQNVNPFFSSSTMTGRIARESKDTVSSQVEEDKDDTSGYFAVIFVLIILLIGMIIIFG